MERRGGVTGVLGAGESLWATRVGLRARPASRGRRALVLAKLAHSPYEVARRGQQGGLWAAGPNCCRTAACSGQSTRLSCEHRARSRRCASPAADAERYAHCRDERDLWGSGQVRGRRAAQASRRRTILCGTGPRLGPCSRRRRLGGGRRGWVNLVADTLARVQAKVSVNAVELTTVRSAGGA